MTARPLLAPIESEKGCCNDRFEASTSMAASGRVLTCGVVPTFADTKFSIGGFREILGTAAPGQEETVRQHDRGAEECPLPAAHETLAKRGSVALR